MFRIDPPLYQFDAYLPERASNFCDDGMIASIRNLYTIKVVGPLDQKTFEN